MKRKKRRKISNFLIVILPIFILLLSFKLIVFDEDFYKKEFNKLGVYEKYDKELVDENLVLLLNFLEKGDNLETDFFNDKEKLHLMDVRNLINKTLYGFYISLLLLIFSVYLLIRRKDIDLISKFLIKGSLLTLLVLILLFLLSFIDFTSFFIKFHLTFFSNSLWLLNPDVDNLINLFPEMFFVDILGKILINSLIISIVLFVFGRIIDKSNF